MAEELGNFEIAITADEDQIEEAQAEGAKAAADVIVASMQDRANAIGREIARGIEDGLARATGGSAGVGGAGAGGGRRSGGGLPGGQAGGGGRPGGILGTAMSKLGLKTLGAAGAVGLFAGLLSKANKNLDAQISRFSGIHGGFAGMHADNMINQLMRDLQTADETFRTASNMNRERERYRDAVRPIQSFFSQALDQLGESRYALQANLADVFSGESGLPLFDRILRLFGPQLASYDERLKKIEAASIAGAGASERLLRWNQSQSNFEEIDKFTEVALRDMQALSGGIFDPGSVLR